MLMADLGADVIKIEVPGVGDSSRNAGELIGERSSFFETNNRGVKSLTLNLKSEEGREILYKLVEEADVFGQNFRPGAAEKNGFGYDDLKKINPRLVYVSVSGYGTRGPHAALPGTDAIGQATGGIAEAYSTPGQPMRTGVVSVADETCAILTFGGLLAALLHAKSTGIGQKVETSLVGATVRLLGWSLTTIMWQDKAPVTGQARITGSPERPAMSANFADCDGKPFVFQLSGRVWKKAIRALGFFDTLNEKGIADLGLAVSSPQKRDEILAALDELFAQGTREKWVSILREADIVAGVINSMLEASNDPDVLANGYVDQIDLPTGEQVKVHGTPWQFSETPAKIGLAPELGEIGRAHV